jgi:hypothetical protein
VLEQAAQAPPEQGVVVHEQYGGLDVADVSVVGHRG